MMTWQREGILVFINCLLDILIGNSVFLMIHDLMEEHFPGTGYYPAQGHISITCPDIKIGISYLGARAFLNLVEDLQVVRF